jgi:hypothetical protein
MCVQKTNVVLVARQQCLVWCCMSQGTPDQRQLAQHVCSRIIARSTLHTTQIEATAIERGVQPLVQPHHITICRTTARQVLTSMRELLHVPDGADLLQRAPRPGELFWI